MEAGISVDDLQAARVALAKKREGLTYRPSSAGRVMDCPSSALPAETPYNPTSEAANLGSAIHEALQIYGAGLEPDLAKVAQAHNCREHDELHKLVALGRSLHDTHVVEVLPMLAECHYETRISSDLFTGTPDIWAHNGETAAIIDWKTGRVDSNHEAQLAAYAHCLRAEKGMPKSGYITCVVGWVRRHSLEVMRFDDKMIDDYVGMFEASLALAGEEYAPGECCTFCPRQLECKAHNDWLSGSCRALSTIELTLEPSRETLGQLYKSYLAAQKLIARYKKVLKTELARGSIACDPGYVLELRDKKQTWTDVSKAYPVFRKFGFTQEEAEGVLSIGLKKMDEVAATKPGGFAELRQKLEEADALGSYQGSPSTTRLRIRS